MDANENPYEILGIPPSATSTQIKSAYRKLALKYHPDKVAGTPTDKARASQIFTKVGAAYETLSDEDRRREYDSGGQGSGSGAGHARGYQQQQGGFGGGFGGDAFNDPFFGGMGGMGMGMPSMFGRARGGGDPFTDPFRLFEQVFADMHDMHDRHHQQGREHMPDDRQRQSQNSRGGSRRQDPFSDPFFGGMNMGGMMGGMNMGSMMGGMGGFEDMMQQGGGGGGGGGSRGNGGFSSFSSSSSSFGGSSGGNRQSVSTTTQIINGKKVTRTERTTLRPDGTMETTVETSGDEDLQRALENSRMDTGGGSSSRRQLQDGNGGRASQKNSKSSWWKGNQR